MDVTHLTQKQIEVLDLREIMYENINLLDILARNNDTFYKYVDSQYDRFINAQDTYLGYDNQTDTFLVGYDTWYWDMEDNVSGSIAVKFRVDNNIKIIGDMMSTGLFYEGLYDSLHARYPALKDIILD
jgi:hypothetical protein